MDLSILIVNWNTRDYLLRCLRKVYSTIGHATFEVIVVDNASTDDSVAAVRSQYPQVNLIENDENLGFARANNQALAASRGEFVLLLNSDAFVHDGAVDAMIHHLRTSPDTGIAGCRLVYEDGSLQRSCTAFPTLTSELWLALWLDRVFPKSRIFGSYKMTYWDQNDLREVDSVMGACMMVRRAVFDQIGVLDEHFFFSSEEVDFCYRAKQAGWKVRYLPDATATHIWGGSSQQIKTITFLNLYRYRILFFRKHYGGLKTFLYKWILALGSLFKSISGLIASLFTKSITPRSQMRNYWTLLWSLPSY
jgi:GT2 family glycosyltransferase